MPAARIGGADTGIRFAVGAVGFGLPGFRRTHRLALGAQAVALAAGRAAQSAGSRADDDEPNARLRATLRVFLQENRSVKATATRLTLHKKTVLDRVRKAEEGLGRPVGENRPYVELALLARHWLSATVPRQPVEPRA